MGPWKLVYAASYPNNYPSSEKEMSSVFMNLSSLTATEVVIRRHMTSQNLISIG